MRAYVYVHLSNRAACPKNTVGISKSYKSLASIISLTYLGLQYFWETQVNNLKLEWYHLDWWKWMHVNMQSLRASRRLGNVLVSVLKWFWQFPEQYSHYWTREWIEMLPYYSLLKCLYCSFNGLFQFPWVPLCFLPYNLSISGEEGRTWDEGHVRVCCKAEPWAELSRWYSQDCHCFSPDAQSLQAISLNGVHSETSLAYSMSMTRSLQPGCICTLFPRTCYFLHTHPWPCAFRCT